MNDLIEKDIFSKEHEEVYYYYEMWLEILPVKVSLEIQYSSGVCRTIINKQKLKGFKNLLAFFFCFLPLFVGFRVCDKGRG